MAIVIGFLDVVWEFRNNLYYKKIEFKLQKWKIYLTHKSTRSRV